MSELCPRHPQKAARGRCAECRRPFCARCEFLTDRRLFCGPACAREHQRRRRPAPPPAASPVRPEPPAPPLARRPRRAILAPALSAAAAAIGIALAIFLLSRVPVRPSLPEQHARPAVAVARLQPAAAARPARESQETAVPVAASRSVAEAPPVRPRSTLPEEVPTTRPARPARAADSGKTILLSFDAGSSDRGAVEILDALRERDIRTTIFLTGQFIRRYPELTRRVAEDGHEVGNHTFDHPHLTTYARDGRQRTLDGVDEAMIRRELDETASLYLRTTGKSMAPLWRAPFGEENQEIRRWADRAGYRHVSWTHGSGTNLDAFDWVTDPDSPRYRPSERVVSRLLASARPGDIILMHLGSDRADPVADHLPRLLDGFSSEGYRFSTASELLGGGTK